MVSAGMLLPLRSLVLLGLAVTVAASGCGGVQRRLTIRSNPAGARVFIDDYEIGTTPCSVGYVYYGTRKIRLIKDGYETLTTLQEVKAPWFERTPLDFFSENFSPQDIRDERTLDFNLQPQLMVPPDELLTRANGLRQNTQAITPAPQLGPSPTIPGQARPPGMPFQFNAAGQPMNVAPTTPNLAPQGY